MQITMMFQGYQKIEAFHIILSIIKKLPGMECIYHLIMIALYYKYYYNFCHVIWKINQMIILSEESMETLLYQCFCYKINTFNTTRPTKPWSLGKNTCAF